MTASYMILVIGGAGYIGSHMVKELISHGCLGKRRIQQHIQSGQQPWIQGTWLAAKISGPQNHRENSLEMA
ncbi:MAG: NAD-dependent epimerase/dehydratase family protein [Desulfobacteraceae bacterium]|nr:NAD-dependent epimerase/dehydratase family protein [Desulfobacteraceae bacterium]